MAFKYHPDRFGDGEMMRMVNKAFDILSDQDQKKKTDEEYAKSQSYQNNFNGNDYPNQFIFKRTKPKLFCLRLFRRRSLTKDPTQFREIRLTPQEFEYGTIIKVNHSKRIYKNDKDFLVIDKILYVYVNPNTKPNTQIKFKRECDHRANSDPGDLIFVLRNKVSPPQFTFDESDIYCKLEVNPRTEKTNLTLPNGQVILIDVKEAIVEKRKRNYYLGRGFPRKCSNTFGNLYVDLIFQD